MEIGVKSLHPARNQGKVCRRALQLLSIAANTWTLMTYGKWCHWLLAFY